MQMILPPWFSVTIVSILYPASSSKTRNMLGFLLNAWIAGFSFYLLELDWHIKFLPELSWN